jgi:hypothetical protein
MRPIDPSRRNYFLQVRVIMNRMTIASVLALSALSAVGSSAYGQNQNYPGYLGVYVVEGNGGMRISGFIPDTPAEQLAFDGGLDRYDTIVRLGGRPTRSLSELRFARNRIPDGQEAKMVLRTRQGDYYYVWIARSPAVAMAIAPGQYGSAGPGSANPGAGAPDRIYRGGTGQGGDQNFRPQGSGEGDVEGSVGSPAPGSAPSAPRAPRPRNTPPSDDDGDFRPKKN